MPQSLRYYVLLLFLTASLPHSVMAQALSANDTIRLGGVEVAGAHYPFIFLPECTIRDKGLDADEIKRLNTLRVNVFYVYRYALLAGTVFKEINQDMDKLDTRKDRKQYLKKVDNQLDECFKKPLKNLSIEQGHVLIRLINRQTGKSCYKIIRELKGDVSAVLWQSVGIVFNNNLRKEYDPTGDDKDIERITQELEASAGYGYQLYLQNEMLKKVHPN
ncbi:MAG: DUF4294 domain-containing protein [Chitinophagia bacterium]|nr:DUF4294 domain-containing protein [Chitinophagia bacterium]